MRDHNERKLRMFAATAKRFIRAADALVDARGRVLQTRAGMPSRTKAAEKEEKASATYDAAKAELMVWVEDMGKNTGK